LSTKPSKEGVAVADRQNRGKLGPGGGGAGKLGRETVRRRGGRERRIPPARGRVTGCAVRTGPFLVRALNALFITPRLPLDPLLLRLLAAYLERQEGWELAFDPVFRPPQSLEG